MSLRPSPAASPGSKHWHYIYKKRRRAYGIKPSQLAWGQAISLIGSIIAGLHLESNKGTLALIVGAFVVLPGVFDLDGSLGAALSAKINHKLEKPRTKSVPVFLESVGYAMLIATLAGLLVSALGATLAVRFFDASFQDVFMLSQSAIMLSAALGFPLIGFLTLFFRKLRVNPDDVVGPIESSIFDMLTVITMAIAIGWIAG